MLLDSYNTRRYDLLRLDERDLDAQTVNLGLDAPAVFDNGLEVLVGLVQDRDVLQRVGGQEQQVSEGARRDAPDLARHAEHLSCSGSASRYHTVRNGLTAVAGGLLEDGRAGQDLGSEVELAELQRLHGGESVRAIGDVHADVVRLLERHVTHGLDVCQFLARRRRDDRVVRRARQQLRISASLEMACPDKHTSQTIRVGVR